MLDPTINFGLTTVSTGYDSAATSIVLQNGGGAKLPNITNGDFNVVWWDSTNYTNPADDPNVEIVRVTAVSTDTLTITRGQENTTAQNHNTAGHIYYVADILTAKVMNTDVPRVIQNQEVNYATDTGSANAYVITLTPAPTAYVVGQRFTFLAANANTGTSTLNVNSLGAKTIKKFYDVALSANDIVAGQVVEVEFDGTNFQLLSLPGAVTGTGAVVLATSPTLTKPTVNGSTGALTTDTDGATITFDMSASNNHQVTLGGNRTLAISNGSTGQIFTIKLIQDATGSRTVTWFSTISWAGGTAPTLTTTASKADRFIFIVTGTGTYEGYVVGQNI